MQDLCKHLKRFLLEEQAATAVEYAVMLALILLACFATIEVLGDVTGDSFQNASDEFNSYF